MYQPKAGFPIINHEKSPKVLFYIYMYVSNDRIPEMLVLMKLVEKLDFLTNLFLQLCNTCRQVPANQYHVKRTRNNCMTMLQVWRERTKDVRECDMEEVGCKGALLPQRIAKMKIYIF